MSTTPECVHVPHSYNAQDLAIVLTCPDCGTRGYATIEGLAREKKCHGCGAAFVIGRDGREKSRECVPKLQIPCPRCRETQATRAGVSIDWFRCAGCKLEIKVPRRPNRISAPAKKEHLEKSPAQQLSPVHVRRAVVLGSVVLLAMIVVVGVWSLGYRISPELMDANRKFMLATIQDNQASACEWVQPGQEADFRQWGRMTVRDAMDGKSLPVGATLEVRLNRWESSLVWVDVEIGAKKKQGQVVLALAWRQAQDGAWRFDAAETMKNAPRHPRKRAVFRR